MSLLTYSWLCQTLEVLEKEAEEHTHLSASPFLLFTFSFVSEQCCLHLEHLQGAAPCIPC